MVVGADDDVDTLEDDVADAAGAIGASLWRQNGGRTSVVYVNSLL